MIDEKKLIEGIEIEAQALEGKDEKYYKGKIAGLRTAEALAKLLPKIGEWIPCSERLPEEKINPITNDFYEYQVTFKSENVTDIRHYKFGDNHWWSFGQNMDKYVTAWQPLPDVYKERD